MPIELSKSQKKIARELIQEGLQRECKGLINEVEKLTHNPDWDKVNPHDLYLRLYKKVSSFDKHIERHYDDMRGSKYFFAVIRLYLDGIISLEDIEKFDVEIKDKLLQCAKLYSEEK